MTTTINGLHSCKPGNEPKIGDIKTFVIEQKTSAKGKPWLKIKSASAEYGGTPHRILLAEKTDFVDSHGNLSFNLEIEPAVGAPTPAAFGNHQSRIDGPPQRQDDRSARIERQHSQEMALRFMLQVGKNPSYQQLSEAIDWFERDIDQSVKLRPATPKTAMDGDYAPMRGPTNDEEIPF